MKYLIAGLGNIGEEYKGTRHNIGFEILDSLAEESGISFSDKRYGQIANLKYKARNFVLLKPSTYVNLSGSAVNYWLKKEKLPEDKLLVLTDDLALPFGSIRIRAKGGDAGHNGLKHINQTLGHSNYARLRFGISDDNHSGQQVDYVLGKWSDEESEQLPQLIAHCKEAIKSFGTIGIERTMNFFNKK